MTAKKFASGKGFKSAIPIPAWNGYECYEAIYGGTDLNDIPAIGYPQIILKNGDMFRMATIDEALRYMNEAMP